MRTTEKRKKDDRVSIRGEKLLPPAKGKEDVFIVKLWASTLSSPPQGLLAGKWLGMFIECLLRRKSDFNKK